jgi:hypothetical protein
VELWPAADFHQQVTAFDSGGHNQSLRGLGSGAVYETQNQYLILAHTVYKHLG